MSAGSVANGGKVVSLDFPEWLLPGYYVIDMSDAYAIQHLDMWDFIR